MSQLFWALLPPFSKHSRGTYTATSTRSAEDPPPATARGRTPNTVDHQWRTQFLPSRH